MLSSRVLQTLGTVLVGIGDGLVIPKMNESEGPGGFYTAGFDVFFFCLCLFVFLAYVFFVIRFGFESWW